ncbi:unnamed protein product [Rotaria sordida]|uniref:Uncharacterized protein n=1 Tax=Rotaria sordida TaxID=392033 RepID=A0A819GWG1_9BILA|nr:unnamed protein product [Rotaria sordida]
MDGLISILFLTTWIALSASGESLFSLACSQANQTCTLYRIDIDQSGGRAISNEIAQWHQLNVIDGFGSVAGFKNTNTPLIIMTTACDSHANLINLNQVSQSLVPVMMKTSCTQPMHPLGSRYVLGLGTMPNGVGGSYPISLYVFDAISGEWNQTTVLLRIDIVNFGTTFAGSYQVLHPQTGFAALNLNMREPFFNVILYNLVNETRHMLSISIETGRWTLEQISNNLLRNFAFSTVINAPVSDCFLGGICLLNPENY